MVNCAICHKHEGTKAAIVKGTYYSQICPQCYEDLLAGTEVSTGAAEYDRGRDFEDHQADIAQPWTKDGKPSADFVRLYPDTAKKVMTEDQINEALRK